MTLTQISDFCTQTVGDVSEEMKDFAKRAIRLKYQTLYDAHLWRESMRLIEDIPLDPSLQGVFFLPFDAEEVIFLSMSYDGRGYTRLAYRERDWIERVASSQVSLPGNTPWFYRGENLAWPAFNPGLLTFTSYETAIFDLYVAGTSSAGFPIAESYKMQAITNPDGTVNPVVVTTSNSFASVTMLSKGQTTQPLSIAAQFPPGPPLFTIQMPGGLSELVFTQIILTPTPRLLNDDGSARVVLIRSQVKLKPDSLDSDFSVPRISHIMDALIEFTLSSLYKKVRQLAKADASEQKGIAHIQAAVNLEKNQSEMRQQVVPVIYESGNYLGGGEGVVNSFNPFG